jgi:hypothetical protein
MTDEEILSAADACGMMLFGLGMDKAKFEFCILAFAKFVGKMERFKERKACAKLCEDYMKETAIMEARGCLASVAYDIRVRGEQA